MATVKPYCMLLPYPGTAKLSASGDGGVGVIQLVTFVRWVEVPFVTELYVSCT